MLKSLFSSSKHIYYLCIGWNPNIFFKKIFSPKVDDNTDLGLKTSSAEKSNQTPQFVTYSNFSTQEYSATQSNHNYNAAQGTLSHNAFDELKLQQLQYQKVFQKHNNHQLPHNMPDSKRVQQNNMLDISVPESREMQVSASGIPLQDSEYENHPFPPRHHQLHHLDDDNVLDDGENSQIDLVEHASKQ